MVVFTCISYPHPVPASLFILRIELYSFWGYFILFLVGGFKLFFSCFKFPDVVCFLFINYSNLTMVSYHQERCHCEELATKQSLSGVLVKTLRLLRFAP